MSDSWILIAMTILIVFLLFYMSKRLICSGPILTNSNEELGENERIDWSSASHGHHYCDGEMVGTGTGHSNDYYSNHPIMTICHPTNNNNNNNNNTNNNNNNNFEEKTLDMGNSHMENRLRLQVLITHMILAEKEHKKLELEITRLARLLAVDQGGSNPEECVRNLRNELFPLTSFGNFQSQRLTPQQQRLLSTFPSTFSFISELTSPTRPTNFDIIDELTNNNHCSCRCGRGVGGHARSDISESSRQINHACQTEDKTSEEQVNHPQDHNYVMKSEHNSSSSVLCANDNDNENKNEANNCLNSDTVTNQNEQSENNFNNHNNNKSSRTNNTNVTNTIKDISIGYENSNTAPSTPQNLGNRQIEHDLDNSNNQKYYD